ncbi:hypothetical protein [Azospirillum endophyticum]
MALFGPKAEGSQKEWVAVGNIRISIVVSLSGFFLPKSFRLKHYVRQIVPPRRDRAAARSGDKGGALGRT